jgi:hypothetical protein
MDKPVAFGNQETSTLPHEEVEAKSEQPMNQNKSLLCKHWLKGHCRQKEECLFSHTVENCPDHIGVETCQNTSCNLRHQQIWEHYLRSKCLFGKKCNLLHKSPTNPTVLQTMVNSLQSTVNREQRTVRAEKGVQYSESSEYQSPT